MQAIVKKPPLTPEESVTKQLKIIYRLTTADNGKFFSVEGAQLPY